MIQSIDFVLNNEKKITVIVPDISSKINYYYEPTKQLHRFDEITVKYITQIAQIELSKDILDVALASFKDALRKAINNDLPLPSSVEAGKAIYTLNFMMNKIETINLTPFWIWSSHDCTQTLIYNVKNKIYLEIGPTYPWAYIEPKPGDHYISFEEFMIDYKPFAVELIPHEIAQNWLTQCQKILKSVDSHQWN